MYQFMYVLSLWYYSLFSRVASYQMVLVLRVISESLGVLRVYPVCYACKVMLDVVVREPLQIAMYRGMLSNQSLFTLRKGDYMSFIDRMYEVMAPCMTTLVHTVVPVCSNTQIVKPYHTPTIQQQQPREEPIMALTSRNIAIHEVTLGEVLMNMDVARRLSISVDDLDVVLLRPDEPEAPAHWDMTRNTVGDSYIYDLINLRQEAYNV